MHGMVVTHLKKFVAENHGEDTWRALADAAGFESPMVLPTKTYPDEYVVNLVAEASEATGASPGDIQHAFGEYIASELMDMYRARIDSSWSALDLFEHTEDQIHEIVRIDNPNSSPPELDVSRPSDDEVLIKYGSERQLCDVAKGIVEGVAAEYGESVTVRERSCMHSGAGHCEISVRAA